MEGRYVDSITVTSSWNSSHLTIGNLVNGTGGSIVPSSSAMERGVPSHLDVYERMTLNNSVRSLTCKCSYMVCSNKERCLQRRIGFISERNGVGTQSSSVVVSQGQSRSVTVNQGQSWSVKVSPGQSRSVTVIQGPSWSVKVSQRQS